MSISGVQVKSSEYSTTIFQLPADVKQTMYALTIDVEPTDSSKSALYYIKGVTADVSTYEIWYTDLLGNEKLFINQKAFSDIVGSSAWTSSVVQNITFDNNGFLNHGYLYVLTNNWIFRFDNNGNGQMVATIDVTQIYQGNYGFVYDTTKDVLYYTTNGGVSLTPYTEGVVYKLVINDGVVGKPEILLDVGDVTRPKFLAVDKYENLYITTDSYSVLKYNMGSSKFISYQFLPIDGITIYQNIIIDTVSEFIYAVEIGKDNTYSLNQYDYAGTPPALPPLNPDNVSNPYEYTLAILQTHITSLACDKSGLLYFIDNGNKSIESYVPNTTILNPVVPVIPVIPLPPIITTTPVTNVPTPYVYNDSAVHIGNICFPENTPIHTDQGIVSIKSIDLDVHTINSKIIVAVTKTVLLEKFLVCFEKNALFDNYPNQKTIMSGEHKIKYNGKMIKAKKFIGCFDGVKVAKYNGQVLYNILLNTHETINVNGMICETLNPINAIAQLYIKGMDNNKRINIIKQMNDSLQRKDFCAYKK
jgi:hypothetical protein